MLHKFSHIIYGAMFLSLFALSAPINADENPISPAPAVDIQATHTETPNIAPAPFAPRLNLAPNETHSGLRLPRWVSLKYGDVNGRKGPGKTYPHLWTFQRKGMPVIVVNEMDHWRKIRDIEGGESWVRSVALSGYNTAIVTQKTPLRKTNAIILTASSKLIQRSQRVRKKAQKAMSYVLIFGALKISNPRLAHLAEINSL